jgi:signal transduction histidine kinase
MGRWARAATLNLAAEAGLAFLASAAFFALAAAAIPLRDVLVVILPLGAAYLYVVLVAAKRLGPLYGVPLALAAGLALDSFYIPPTREFGAADWQNWLVIAIYLLLGALVGMLGARAQRRAESSEQAGGDLADEQAALRRVATLVARGVSPEKLFAAVAEEVGMLLKVDWARVVRFVSDDEILQLEGWTKGQERLPVGRLKLEGTSLSTEVLRTGRPVRIENYASVNRVVPWFVQQIGVQSGAAAPITVDGRLWGAMLVWTLPPHPLPEKVESRLAGFTELVATAISNSAAQEELARLADEQAALRRVATLIAGGAPPPDVFAAVAEELGRLLGVHATHILRFDPEGNSTSVGSWSTDSRHLSVGTRHRLDSTSLMGLVFMSGGPARIDGYDRVSDQVAAMAKRLSIRSAVGAPIAVDGQLWGVMIASSDEPEPLAAGTESRIAGFTELVATSISNTEARAEVGRLAEEQAALRRVATLVAREAPPEEVFAKVAEEVNLLLGAESAWMYCYEPAGAVTVVARSGQLASEFPVGLRRSLEAESITGTVLRTGRTARIDDYAEATGALGTLARELGIRSAVGSPIIVEGRLWGAMAAATLESRPLPVGSESRIEEFTELVATAISNMQARSDLAASRARIVAATDEERRRVVRDLHDGAQQRLVHTVVTLKMASRALEDDGEAVPVLVTEALENAEAATRELRELAHGILPSVLTRGGLRAGVVALASRTPMPVDVKVWVDRFAPAVEATAYFVVAEVLTNVAKHSRASRAAVTARVEKDTLQVEIQDDGVGGAEREGSGLLGLADRLAVLDGTLRVESPPDGGTLVTAAIPLARTGGEDRERLRPEA